MFPQIPHFGAALSIFLTEEFSFPRTVLEEKGRQLSQARETLTLCLPKKESHCDFKKNLVKT